MIDLVQFRERVTICRKRQIDPATERPYTLKALAGSIGLSADELGHRLRGTGRSKLSSENVFAIVRTLAEWDTLTWDESIELLTCMEYPLDPPDWQRDLQRLLGPASQSAQQTITSHGASKEQELSSLIRRRPKTFKEINGHTRIATSGPNSDSASAHVLTKQQPENEPIVEVEAIPRKIEKIIDALSNFHSNPEGIYYIGQTLVECGAFLEELCIDDETTSLIDDLIEEIDTDERREEGLFDPVISIGKVRKLIHRLREIRKRLIQSRIV